MKELTLKYGCNPNQKPAKVYAEEGLPINVLNGNPGYINLLDALNGWQLVKELSEATGLPAAASFKHVSPAGAAVGTPFSDDLAKAYFVDNLDVPMSPLAYAYARARGADRVASYGDFVSLSHTVDVPTAKILSTEVSDGIIAPDYESEAMNILMAKQKGRYLIIKVNKDYVPPEVEKRTIYGVTFEQHRNDCKIDVSLLNNIVSKSKDLSESAVRDLLVALITLKYTQSNSVCYAKDGQAIGVGAGQQARLYCTRLAGTKADTWFLRQHPAILELEFTEGVKNLDKNNIIDQLLQDDAADFFNDDANWKSVVTKKPYILTKEDKTQWLTKLQNVSLASDAFFPFGDNIERAHKSGVKYIAAPFGSIRDDNVIATCDEYNMTLAFIGLRLFHH
ncbi:MAG: phosphoribosylaminoimidazolecarboxamide formyltransferase [Oscillospiraceae bacterium]|nr:phosphoribosylaminoimidazolecarboxamide formyltransferase [Oscillospiraceae bacterium]